MNQITAILASLSLLRKSPPQATMEALPPAPGAGGYEPEPEAELSPDDLKDAVKDDILATNTVGMERREQLEQQHVVPYNTSRRMYHIRHTATDDFMDKANKAYLLDNYSFLSSQGEWGVGIDLDEVAEEILGERPSYWKRLTEDDYTRHFETWLAKIEDDTWERFIEDMDQLGKYPVLDEQAMSDMEQQADVEFIEGDGLKELQKALLEKPETQDSFLQFFIDHLTPSDVWHYLSVHDSYEFQHEEGSSWMNMESYADDLSLEELLGEDEGYAPNDAGIPAKVARLRRHFAKMKAVAFKHRIEKPLRDAVERALEADPEKASLAATFRTFDRDTLFQLVLRLVPDSAFADEDAPAWREEAARRPEAPVERPDQPYYRLRSDYRMIWTIAVESPQREAHGSGFDYPGMAKAEMAGIELLALDVVDNIERWAAVQAANDPRQLKLPGFECRSAARVAAHLLEDEDDVKADLIAHAPLVNVYEDADLLIEEVRNDAAFPYVPKGVFDSEQNLDFVLSWCFVFYAQSKRNPNHWTVYRVPRIEEEGVSIACKHPRALAHWDYANLFSQLPVAAKPLGVLIETYLKDDPAHMLSILFNTFGPDALADHADLVAREAKDSFMRFAYAVGMAQRGDIRRAVRQLNSPTSRATQEGLWIFVKDFEDLTGVFDKRQRDAAKDVFTYENWSWFDSDGLPSVRDALGWLKPKHEALVMAAMAGIEYEDDDGTTAVYDPKESMGTLSELLEKPEFEEVADAVRRAVDNAGQTARMDKSWKVWTDAAIEALGATQYKFENDPAKPGGDRLGLLIPWSEVRKIMAKAVDSVDNVRDVYIDRRDVADFMIANRVQDAEVNDREDYWAAPEDWAIEENLNNDLPEPPGLPGNAAAVVTPPPAQEALLQERVYGKSCLMVKVPGELADAVQTWAKASIPEERLYHSEKEDGFEDDPHITCIWGLLEPDVSDELRAIVERTRVFPVKLGKVSLFENEDFDVVKLEVESPWLHQLHQRIKSEVPNRQTHPVYNPHVTLAYAKKGSCADLVGHEVFSGDGAVNPVFYVEELQFSGAGDEDVPGDRHEELLPLDKTAQPSLAEGAPVDPFSGVGFAADVDRLMPQRRARFRRARRLARQLI